MCQYHVLLGRRSAKRRYWRWRDHLNGPGVDWRRDLCCELDAPSGLAASPSTLVPNFSKARATDPMQTRFHGWANNDISDWTLKERGRPVQLAGGLVRAPSIKSASGSEPFLPLRRPRGSLVASRPSSLDRSLRSLLELQPVSLDTDPDLRPKSSSTSDAVMLLFSLASSGGSSSSSRELHTASSGRRGSARTSQWCDLGRVEASAVDRWTPAAAATTKLVDVGAPAGRFFWKTWMDVETGLKTVFSFSLTILLMDEAAGEATVSCWWKMEPTVIFLTLLGRTSPVVALADVTVAVAPGTWHWLKLVISSLTDSLLASFCLLAIIETTDAPAMMDDGTSSCLVPHAHDALLRFKHDVNNWRWLSVNDVVSIADVGGFTTAGGERGGVGSVVLDSSAGGLVGICCCFSLTGDGEESGKAECLRAEKPARGLTGDFDPSRRIEPVVGQFHADLPNAGDRDSGAGIFNGVGGPLELRRFSDEATASARLDSTSSFITGGGGSSSTSTTAAFRIFSSSVGVSGRELEGVISSGTAVSSHNVSVLSDRVLFSSGNSATMGLVSIASSVLFVVGAEFKFRLTSSISGGIVKHSSDCVDGKMLLKSPPELAGCVMDVAEPCSLFRRLRTSCDLERLRNEWRRSLDWAALGWRTSQRWSLEREMLSLISQRRSRDLDVLLRKLEAATRS